MLEKSEWTVTAFLKISRDNGISVTDHKKHKITTQLLITICPNDNIKYNIASTGTLRRTFRLVQTYVWQLNTSVHVIAPDIKIACS